MRKLIENWPLDGFIICNRHVSAVRKFGGHTSIHRVSEMWICGNTITRHWLGLPSVAVLFPQLVNSVDRQLFTGFPQMRKFNFTR